MLNEKRRRVWYFAVAFLVLFSIFSLMIASFGAHEANGRKEEARRETELYAERIESLLRNLFHKTDILESIIITSNGTVPEETFNDLAKSLLDGRGIRAIQYLPDGIVKYCYPLAGNEKAIGDDVFAMPERRADASLAVRTKDIVLSGPYELTQGGLGLVARNPIFLTGSGEDERFWGFAVIILELPEAVAPVRLEKLENSGYEYSLHCQVNGRDEVVIEQSEGFSGREAIDSKIMVPNHVWVLSLHAQNGWFAWKHMAVQLSIAFIFSLLCATLVYQNKESQDRIRQMAATDDLTGTMNRRCLNQLLEKACKKSGTPFLLLYMDLNGFKAINDRLGHASGDTLLKEVSSRLSTFLKPGETLARIGGDEFVMVLKGEKDIHDPGDKIRQIREAVGKPYRLTKEEKENSVGISIGTARFPDDADGYDELMVIADQRMYEDKQRYYAGRK